MSKLPNTVTALLESSINRYLNLDPSIQVSLDALESKSVTLLFKEFSFPLYFKIENRRIKVMSETDDATDVCLSASVPTLMQMTFSGDSDESVLGSEIEMTGNMDVGREFRSIFRSVDIDWEEIVSRYTGDIIAHKLGNGFRRVSRWIGSTQHTIRNDITEFLQEESRQLPSGPQVSGYVNAVDEVRQAVDRAEARMKLILKTIERSKESD